MFELEKERADAKIRVARDIISNPTDLRFLGDIERDADHAGWWGTEASLIYLMEGQPPTRRAKLEKTFADIDEGYTKRANAAGTLLLTVDEWETAVKMERDAKHAAEKGGR